MEFVEAICDHQESLGEEELWWPVSGRMYMLILTLHMIQVEFTSQTCPHKVADIDRITSLGTRISAGVAEGWARVDNAAKYRGARGYIVRRDFIGRCIGRIEALNSAYVSVLCNKPHSMRPFLRLPQISQ